MNEKHLHTTLNMKANNVTTNKIKVRRGYKRSNSYSNHTFETHFLKHLQLLRFEKKQQINR